MKIVPFVCAAVFIISPMAGALAQSSLGPSIGADNKKEAAEIKTGTASKSATNTETPGATGTHVVPGSGSTIEGDKSGTAETKTGGVSGGSR